MEVGTDARRCLYKGSGPCYHPARWPQAASFSLPEERPQRREDILMLGAFACLGYSTYTEGK